MRFRKLNITLVLSATLLFGVFTLMHEYGWLIPPSPVATVASTSQVPLPDVVEEHGSEDAIEHHESNPIFISPILSIKGSYMIYEELFIPHVATPPPDMV